MINLRVFFSHYEMYLVVALSQNLNLDNGVARPKTFPYISSIQIHIYLSLKTEGTHEKLPQIETLDKGAMRT